MSADRLIKLLSTAFHKDKDSNNYKLLKVLTEGLDEIEDQIELIKKSRFLDTAYGKSLDYIAALLNIRRSNESDSELRQKIIMERAKQLSCGTKQDVITSLNFLGIEKVTIKEYPDTDWASFTVLLDADEYFSWNDTVLTGYGVSAYGEGEFGGIHLNIKNLIKIIGYLSNIKAAGVKVNGGLLLGVQTKTSALIYSILEKFLKPTAKCEVSAHFNLELRMHNTAKCTAVSTYGYSEFGYNENGYGGVW